MRKKFLAIFFVGIASMLASVSAQVVQRDGGATPFRTVTPDENGVTVSYGQDIRTSIMDSQIKSTAETGAAEIESVSQEGGILRIKVKTPELSSATLSLKSLEGNYSTVRNVENDMYAEFDVTGLNKGIYTVTLSVDGKNIETTKTILK